MAFVYEKIDSARAKELLKAIPKHWVLSMSPIHVIDVDSDLVFLELGGKGDLPPEYGEPPSYYALLWKGEAVLFSGHDKKNYKDECVLVDINLGVLRAPSALQGKVMEIQKAIEDAMACYWEHITWNHKYKPQHATVAVQFPAAQFY